MKILFLCVANSARSQMAEGLAKQLLPKSFDIRSAGSNPSGQVHSGALSAMKKINCDISEQTSKAIDDLDKNFLEKINCVITLCAEEVCPTLLSNAQKFHWPVDDPAAFEDEEQIEAFERARDFIKEKITEFKREVIV